MTDLVQEKIIEFVAKYSECPVEDITPTTKLLDTGIDSIGVAELIFEFEEYFDITIEDSEEIQNRFDLGTIEDVTQLVHKQKEQRGSAA